MLWVTAIIRYGTSELANPFQRNVGIGLSVKYIKEALALDPMLHFLHLSLGGVLALSEWWFWETMCFVAGSFGVVRLCAHTIAYNLIPILFMIPSGTSIGLTVQMGHVIADNPGKAQRMAAWTMLLIVIVGASVSLCLHTFQLPIIRLFTNDPDVIHASKAIWPKVCYYVFVLYVFGINGAIHRRT